MRKRLYNRLGVKVLGVVVLSFVLCTAIMLRLVVLYVEGLLKYHISFNNAFVCYFPVAVAILLFVSIFLALVNTRMRYFRYIIRSVKEIDSVEFIGRLEEKGHDEFAELAQNINIMNARIQERFIREKEIEESKNELITLVSHDLKTPLTSLIGYIELLNTKKDEDPIRREYIEIAYNKSIRLKTMVNELFEYTRLSGSDIKLDLKRINLSNFINQVVGESILDFDKKNIEVVLDNPYKELYYDVDASLFIRVLENLVGNAEKYSDENTKFHVIVNNKDAEMTISFINTCEKLKESALPWIFEKFYREDSARSSENEGTGLGLTIAKRIIELHGGTLSAKKYGADIAFIINLKYEKTDVK